MDSNTIILIVAIVMLVAVAALIVAAAYRTRKHERLEKRRQEAAAEREEAAEISRAAERRDAEAEELAARARRERAEADERTAAAKRMQAEAQRRKDDARGHMDRADELDPDRLDRDREESPHGEHRETAGDKLRAKTHRDHDGHDDRSAHDGRTGPAPYGARSAGDEERDRPSVADKLRAKADRDHGHDDRSDTDRAAAGRHTDSDGRHTDSADADRKRTAQGNAYTDSQGDRNVRNDERDRPSMADKLRAKMKRGDDDGHEHDGRTDQVNPDNAPTRTPRGEQGR